MPLVSVLLPLKFDQPLTYHAEQALLPGTLVDVPLGKKRVIGCVWDSPPQAVDAVRLKQVGAAHHALCFQKPFRDFIDWVARFTLTPRGQVLKLALRENELHHEPAVQKRLRLLKMPETKQTAARQKVLALMGDGFARSRADILRETGVSAGVLSALIAASVLEEVDAAPSSPPPLDYVLCNPALSSQQEIIAQELRRFVAARAFQSILLHGATGSGKTEVYFDAVAAALQTGGQALVMVPEIALTGQFLKRFEHRFGGVPVEWHSRMSPARRAEAYRRVASGEAQVVVGARSALFLPFSKLQLIVVDEEHESAYRQEDHVLYHARDMAVARAKFEHCPVVLASATPSLESWMNAASGRYVKLDLPERFGQKALPDIQSVDLRPLKMKSGEWLSPALHAKLTETFEAGQQSLLFLNRRGYAPLTLCRHCGHRVMCPQCSAALVVHKNAARLQCHHCGFAQAMPEACPACGDKDKLISIGLGVERLAEDVQAQFPHARVLTLSSDMAGGLLKLHEDIERIARGDVNIVIGTQLVAKGHNFPGLTFVGVVDGDFSLSSGDPRAGERTFQVLNQVIGRAGRGAVAGTALVQTYQPDHPVLQALIAGDHQAFYQAEASQRQAANLPPAGRLAAIIVSDKDTSNAFAYARALARNTPKSNEIKVLGPAEAPLFRLKGRSRYRLLVKAPREADLQAYLRHWLSLSSPPKAGLKCVIDIDPYNFL